MKRSVGVEEEQLRFHCGKKGEERRKLGDWILGPARFCSRHTVRMLKILLDICWYCLDTAGLMTKDNKIL